MRETFVGAKALTQRNDVRGRPSPAMQAKPQWRHVFEAAPAGENEANA